MLICLKIKLELQVITVNLESNENHVFFLSFSKGVAEQEPMTRHRERGGLAKV